MQGKLPTLHSGVDDSGVNALHTLLYLQNHAGTLSAATGNTTKSPMRCRPFDRAAYDVRLLITLLTLSFFQVVG